jgi:hypothetical protein
MAGVAGKTIAGRFPKTGKAVRPRHGSFCLWLSRKYWRPVRLFTPFSHGAEQGSALWAGWAALSTLDFD